MRTLLKYIILILFLGHHIKVQGQLRAYDSIPRYDFVRYDMNKISTNDSSALADLFEKIWTFEEKDSSKIKMLHIGDSHIQAGYFTGKIRESLHNGFGCGTRERGFVFPYGLAHTNGPNNYAAQYTGDWKGYKCASNTDIAQWGVSGIVAQTFQDSTSIKIYSNNHTFDSYQFSSVRLFYKDDSSAFNIQLNTSDLSATISKRIDSLGGFIEFLFSEKVDTLYFSFFKDSLANEKDAFEIQGFELRNELPGITYSEVGVNGAKVSSFLKCREFSSQLSILQPDLILISLGTNDAYNLSYNDSVFEEKYDSLLQVVRESSPEVAIILTTPSDCKRYRKNAVTENLRVRKIILKLAKKYNCGVWDLFMIMGGLNSIDRWHENRLTASDKVHFNEAGYHFQGQLFFAAFAESYNDHTASRRSVPVFLNEGIDIQKFVYDVLFHSAKNPLIFSDYLFWVLFAVFFLLYSFLYKNVPLRTFYLFGFSLFFYYKAGGFYFLLLLFSTVVDFVIGNQIYQGKTKNRKLFWLWTSLTINLGLLAFFKYSYFILDSIHFLTGVKVEPINIFNGLSNLITGQNTSLTEIILPVGISFFTFQTISYSIDIYRDRIEPVKSIVDFGFFVSFFPQLVAGPIVRANEFIPQIHKKIIITKTDLYRASTLILGGLFKKMVISDYISSNFVDRVFETPLKYSGFENLMGCYGYTLQIYCDFSAYSDIAIGLALILGFTLPENFRTPYLSKNITDFWRRWHMSLSRWLKDYLYISLGGNRKSKIRTRLNLLLTMLIGGLWHGASMKFIIWGGLHGVALVVHKEFIRIFPKISKKETRLSSFVSWFITFHFIVFCWIFFRAADLNMVQTILSQIIFDFRVEFIVEFLSTSSYQIIFSLIVLGYLLHVFPKKWLEGVNLVFYRNYWKSVGFIAVFLIVVIYQFKSSEIHPFIYFQF